MTPAAQIQTVPVAALAPGPAFVAVSYNIRKAVGADRRRDPARVLGVIAEMAADVAVLQEVDLRFGDRSSTIPQPLLADHGLRPVPFDTRPESLGWHGNTILVSDRVEILSQRVLSLPSLEPRGAVMADLLLEGALLRVVGMHLDLSGFMRRRQVETILEALAAEPGSPPTLLMGDMNEWRPTALQRLAPDLHPVPLGPSFPARLPIGRLDRVFISSHLRVKGQGVHVSPQARLASDHLPVWVRLGLAAGA
ncbi:endonuclease/exonuclease/phosphatase family protein [Thermaurantiacus sp.]